LPGRFRRGQSPLGKSAKDRARFFSTSRHGISPGLPSRGHPSSLVGPDSERKTANKERQSNRSLDDQPSRPGHSHDQGRLAGGTQPGGECAGGSWRDKDFVGVRFNSTSPHFTATVRAGKPFRSESRIRVARALPRAGRQFLGQTALREPAAARSVEPPAPRSVAKGKRSSGCSRSRSRTNPGVSLRRSRSCCTSEEKTSLRTDKKLTCETALRCPSCLSILRQRPFPI
jgi:hypothetical protein